MAGNFCYYRVPGERTAERVGYARAEDLPPLGPEERGKNVMYYYPDAQETYPVYLRECGEEHATAEKCVENRINPKVTYLHFLLRGRGTFNGLALTAGEGFAAHAGCVHSLCAAPVDPMEFVYIGIGGYDHARWLASLGFSREEPFFSFSYENRLTAFLRNALYRTPVGVRAPAYLLGMLTLLLSYQYPLSPAASGEAHEKYLAPAKQMMADSRYTISVSELAAALGISRRYFSVLFHAATGLSVRDYLLAHRISLAKNYLANGYSVARTAELLGYGDYAAFYNAFSRLAGVSPARYAAFARAPGQTADR